eukprot:NODE_2174_length_634_cov_43.504931_g2124_i0.p1 GENE.NODE_2174_length_634_cov_43.504931_g2124_i0~~NODE_2174_length_634_cov_43.504931_g2124_i0.p1  ORF type:complete len:109 (-),score=8.59 NODE_2174_length_634_cov_43.504931_g2124_i0:80-406(-)
MKLIWPRTYLLDAKDVFSLQDLVDISNNQLVPFLERVTQTYRQHVTSSCVVCRMKGSYCEFCRSEEIIYPFDLSKTLACADCNTLAHKKCYDAAKCPKCARMKKRAKT